MAQERRFVDPHANEVGDFGELRAGQPYCEGSDDVVSRFRIGVDRQQPGRFDVDKDVPVVFVDADLRQRNAGSADCPSSGREIFDRHIARHPPTAIGAGPGRGERRRRGQVDLDGAVGRAADDDDSLLSVSQHGGRSAYGDVDAQEPLPGVEAAQHPLRRHHVGIRERDPCRWFGGPETGPSTGCQQGDDAGGDQRRLADSDR